MTKGNKFAKGQKKGFRHREETKLRISLSMKGKNTWSMGRKHTEEELKKMSSSHKGIIFSEDRKRNISKSLTGRKLLEETKEKLRTFMKGRKPSLETINKRKESMKKKFLEGKLKTVFKKGIIPKGSVLFKKGRKPTKEELKKMFKKRDKSSLEIKFEDIIKQYNLPYKFVGNGDFVISGKCPDFINTNGEKIAIEVYYKNHKEMWGQAKGIGIEIWKENRQKIFNQYGWQIEFFDETQVKPEIVMSRLGGN